MKYLQSYFSDIGTRRESNQDSLCVLKANTRRGEIVLAVLCDGMGGYQAGEYASRMITETFEQWFRNDFPKMLKTTISFEKIQSQWDQLLRECNHRLVVYGENNGGSAGSTATAILFVNDEYFICHVGDSRAYIVGPQNIFQLTEDQSVVAEEIRNGRLTEQEALYDRRRNILLECVGVTDKLNIEFYSGNILPQACYLLCSDGLWHFLNEEDYTNYLAGNLFDDNNKIRMHLRYLFEQVKQRGEQDNISAIAIVPLAEDEEE